MMQTITLNILIGGDQASHVGQHYDRMAYPMLSRMLNILDIGMEGYNELVNVVTVRIPGVVSDLNTIEPINIGTALVGSCNKSIPGKKSSTFATENVNN